jgi:hypothetical protein
MARQGKRGLGLGTQPRLARLGAPHTLPPRGLWLLSARPCTQRVVAAGQGAQAARRPAHTAAPQTDADCAVSHHAATGPALAGGVPGPPARHPGALDCRGCPLGPGSLCRGGLGSVRGRARPLAHPPPSTPSRRTTPTACGRLLCHPSRDAAHHPHPWGYGARGDGRQGAFVRLCPQNQAVHRGHHIGRGRALSLSDRLRPALADARYGSGPLSAVARRGFYAGLEVVGRLEPGDQAAWRRGGMP